MQLGIEVSTALLQYDKSDVEALINVIKDKDQQYAWDLIAFTLGRIGDKRAVEPLIDILRQSKITDSWLKDTVIALGYLVDVISFEPLLPIIDHPDFEIRDAVAWALSTTGDLRAMPLLFEKLLHHEIRNRECFANFGQSGIAFLRECLADTDMAKQLEVIRILHEIGDDQTSAMLSEMAADHLLPAEVRSAAIRAINHQP